MLGGWPGQASSSVATTKRATAHVNPLPARKPSKRAKYGDAATANKERRLARTPKPPVVRPRPKRSTEYFRELIRGVDDRAQPQQQQQQRPPQHTVQGGDQQQAAPGQQPQSHPDAHRQRARAPEDLPQRADEAPQRTWGGLDARVTRPEAHARDHQLSPRRIQGPDAGDVGPGPVPEMVPEPVTGSDPAPNADADSDRVASSAGASTSASAAAAAAAAPVVALAGFRRRRKLFADSPEGPHPRTTAKIVARLAACKHWRRPLAHRLLPRYLPLFDQHAAAYFFKHVPSLQPRPPAGGPWHNSPGTSALAAGAWTPAASAARSSAAAPGGDSFGSGGGTGGAGGPGSAGGGEAAGFERMVVAVCCSLLPKMASFGPRALSCMAAGLGRMGICHGPTLAAWEFHSAPQLRLMRPDQLVSCLEGRAALQTARGPGAESGSTGQTPGDAAAESDAGAGSPATGRGRWTPPRRRNRRWGRQQQQQHPLPPPIGATWRESALAAAQSALPRMTVAEVGRMLQALASLRLSPPPELLAAACARVRAGVAEEAVRLAAAAAAAALVAADEQLSAGGISASSAGVDGGNSAACALGGLDVGQSFSTGSGHGGGGADGTLPDRLALLSVALALDESAAQRAATPYRVGTVGASGGAVGVVVAAAAAAAAAATADRPGWGGKAGGRAGAREAGQRRRPQSPPEPEPVRGGDVARVVRGLGALGYAPSPGWLDWLLGGVGEVLRWQLGGGVAAEEQQQRQWPQPRSNAQGRRMVAAAGDADAAKAAVPPPLGAAPGPAAGSTAVASAAPPSPPHAAPFFSAEDLAELAAGLADLMPALEQAAAAATAATVPLPTAAAAEVQAPASAAAPAKASCGDNAVRGPPSAVPPPVPAECLNLLLDAALDDVRRRLDPATAAAAAAAAAATAPTAILTQGDVTKADAAAVAAAAGTAAAASAAAADATPAASCLLTALLQLLPYYTPPRRWCAAAAGLGLELVPYMPPSALLLWLRSFAAWGVPRPLPPPWHAAAAVSSRMQLRNHSAKELCELPGALAAAAARMPAPWAAHYVRHLVSRLQVLPGDDAMPYDLDPLAAEPSSRRRARRRLGRPLSARCSALRSRRGGGVEEDAVVIAAAATAAAGARALLAPVVGDVALADAAAALGSLPYIVPDLRYVGECEGDALQALARAFGLTADLSQQQQRQQDPQERHQSPGTVPTAPTERALTGAAAAAAATAAEVAAAPVTATVSPDLSEAWVGAFGAVRRTCIPAQRQERGGEQQMEAVAAFLAAAGWAGSAGGLT